MYGAIFLKVYCDQEIAQWIIFYPSILQERSKMFDPPIFQPPSHN